MLEDKMKDIGGLKIAEGLKIDGDPSDADDEIKTWVRSIASDIDA
jgi:hypothetical protein